MKTLRVEAGDVRLSVQRWGKHTTAEPMVVLLPALGETASDWSDVAVDLSRHRQMWAVDLRGHGKSDWPGVYSLALMAHDIRCLLAGFGEAVDLVGHSMGGLVAWLVAASEPSLVRRLVLEEVALLRPRDPVLLARPAGQLDFDWAVVEQVRPEIDTPDLEWAERAAAVAAPTLVIGGGSASFIPQQHVADLANAIPAGRLITMEAGHEVHALRKDEFVNAVQSFLAATSTDHDAPQDLQSPTTD